jgi:hypothetical protein
MSADNRFHRFAAVLREAPSPSGTYHETVLLPSSAAVTYRFSLATGLGFLAAASAYAKALGPPPAWLMFLHPHHRTGLCHYAVASNEPLPTVMPPLPTGGDMSRSHSP